MAGFKRRNPNQKLIYSRPVLAVMFLMLIFLGQAAIKAYIGARDARTAYIGVREERADIAIKSADLEKRLDYLSSSYGLEKELRRQFGLAKPGEELMTIIDRRQKGADNEPGKFSSFLSEIGGFFTGLFNFNR